MNVARSHYNILTMHLICCSCLFPLFGAHNRTPPPCLTIVVVCTNMQSRKRSDSSHQAESGMGLWVDARAW